MKKFGFILYLAAALMMGVAANAQEPSVTNTDGGHWFVGVQGGVSSTLTNYSPLKLLSPVEAVYVGGYYNSVVGGRLHFSGFESKGVFPDVNTALGARDLKYKNRFYDANLDLLVNLTNLFSKEKEHFLNLILVGGVGLNYSWHNKEVNCLINEYSLRDQAPEAWTSDRLTHNVRLGLQLEANISKHFAINLEADANNTNDRFNSKKSNSDDWRLTAALGVAYKFGFKKKAEPVCVCPPKPIEVTPAPKPAPAAVVEPKPAPAPAPKPAPQPVVKKINENVFYNIRSSKILPSEYDKIERVANFLKENPEAKVTITGYADANTGNPKINLKYSQQRANDLKKYITSKYGIDPSRIVTDAKGDTVQPFSDSVKNRVSIVSGEYTVE